MSTGITNSPLPITLCRQDHDPFRLRRWLRHSFSAKQGRIKSPSNPKTMNETQYAIVEAHGVSPIEFGVLYTIDERPQLTRTLIPKFAVFMGPTPYGKHFSQAKYKVAVETCIQKGWLRVITVQDREQDRLRWQNDMNQYCGEIEYQPGDIEFTEVGARLFYRILEELDVAEGKRPYESLSIGYSWSMPGCVRFFGAYADQVMQATEQYVTGKESLGDCCRQIERVEGPFPTGPWWINRFVHLQEGYRCDLYCGDEIDRDEAPSS